jgi:DNA invertase Pin-like site-specific DNA recombinase
MVEVEEFSNPTPKDVVKDRDVFVYARVSGEDQKENSLPAQIEAVKGTLKALGYRKSLRGRIFEEQASGTTLERPELAKAIQAIREHGKPAVLVVRDIQRFSRDPYGLGVLYRPLWEQDIPVAAFTENLVLGTKKNPSPNADLLAPILVAAGGSEVNLRKAQSSTGVAKAKAKGISSGQPVRIYANEPLNPFRELVRLLEAGFGNKATAKRSGRGETWVKKNRAKLAAVRERKGDAGVEEFLTLVDKLREMEQEYGPRFGASVRRQGMVAVGRVVSLYLSKPDEVERPTDEFIDAVFADPKEYLNPKKRR